MAAVSVKRSNGFRTLIPWIVIYPWKALCSFSTTEARPTFFIAPKCSDCKKYKQQKGEDIGQEGSR